METVLCTVELLRSRSSTPLDGHAARVALAAKGGSTPFLILHEDNEGQLLTS